MDLNRDQQVRIMIYSALLLLVAVGGFLFYLVWQDSQDVPVEQVENADKREVAKVNIDSSILDSAKFKELAPIQVIDLGTPGSATSTPNAPDESGRFDAAKLSTIPRRNGNPFRPY